MSGDTIHGAMFWLIFWVSGIGPLLIMLYIPIGLAWIIGYGLYLGAQKIGQKIGQNQGRASSVSRPNGETP